MTHSSVLAWRTPGTEEPGGLWPIVSQRVRHDRSDLACLRVYMSTQMHMPMCVHEWTDVCANQCTSVVKCVCDVWAMERRW